MKRITRIIISFCLMLLLIEGVKGQSVRFGFEGSHGMGFDYTYNYNDARFDYYYEDGSFAYKHLNTLIWSADFYADIIFPRRWTPNWMALSMQVGVGFMQMNYNDDYLWHLFGRFSKNYLSRGINLPVNLEVKFLLSDNIRFYLNGGTVNYMVIADKIDDSFGLTYNYGISDDLSRSYMLGYNYGFGFEFGFFRVGYKLTNMVHNILKMDIGNKYSNIHTISAGIMLNGNRFLKKKSHLKVY